MRPPHFFEFLTPLLPAPQGPMDPRGRRCTSVDIVSTRIQFGVDPSTVAEISLKNHQNAKKSPLTPIVTKISFPPFSAPGPLTPNRGEDTSGTRVRPHAKFGVNRLAGCREIVDRTKNTEKKHTVKQIPCPSL